MKIDCASTYLMCTIRDSGMLLESSEGALRRFRDAPAKDSDLTFPGCSWRPRDFLLRLSFTGNITYWFLPLSTPQTRLKASGKHEIYHVDSIIRASRNENHPETGKSASGYTRHGCPLSERSLRVSCLSPSPPSSSAHYSLLPSAKPRLWMARWGFPTALGKDHGNDGRLVATRIMQAARLDNRRSRSKYR